MINSALANYPACFDISVTIGATTDQQHICDDARSHSTSGSIIYAVGSDDMVDGRTTLTIAVQAETYYSTANNFLTAPHVLVSAIVS